MTDASEPVFLGLGSNLGEREATVADALAHLAERGFRETRRSALYLTEPVGGPPQGWFVNAAAGGTTDLEPRDLLAACLEVERALGRERTVRHGPRTIDVDILFYGQRVLAEEGLAVPHPHLAERRFVLSPLAEIAPGFVHPVSGLTVAELLRRCPDRSRVARRDEAGA